MNPTRRYVCSMNACTHTCARPHRRSGWCRLQPSWRTAPRVLRLPGALRAPKCGCAPRALGACLYQPPAREHGARGFRCAGVPVRSLCLSGVDGRLDAVDADLEQHHGACAVAVPASGLTSTPGSSRRAAVRSKLCRRAAESLPPRCRRRPPCAQTMRETVNAQSKERR